MDEPDWLFNTPEAELAKRQKPLLTQRYQLGLMTGAHHMQVFGFLPAKATLNGFSHSVS